MLNLIKKISDTNLWIAFASVALYQATILQLGLGLQFNYTSLFIFSSSVFAYNILQIIGSKKRFKEVIFFDKLLLFASAIGSFFSLIFLDYATIILFLFAAVLTFFYGIPLNPKSKYDFSLRNIWFLKSMIVALVWTITCSIIPLLEFNATETQLYWFSIEKFLFILGITIPYDIKDLQKDKNQIGMTSLAMKFGIPKTIIIANIILILALCIALYSYSNFCVALILTYISCIIVNSITNEQRSKYWFTFLIDGLIIWYFLLCFVSLYFFQ